MSEARTGDYDKGHIFDCLGKELSGESYWGMETSKAFDAMRLELNLLTYKFNLLLEALDSAHARKNGSDACESNCPACCISVSLKALLTARKLEGSDFHAQQKE